MCDFIIAGLSEAASAIVKRFLPDGIALRALDWPPLRQHFPATHSPAVIAVSSNGCSCGLYLDAAEEVVDEGTKRQQREHGLARKYERLGWSPSKIERALHDSREAATKHSRVPAALTTVQQIERALGIAVSETGDDLYLLVHRFGRPEDETLALQGTHALGADSISLDAANLPLNHLVRHGA